MITHSRCSAALAACGLLAASSKADFAPIPLASDSFNQDLVVESGAIHAPTGATTASMDAGSDNTAFGWYEVGYNQSAADTGLPAAGSTVASVISPDHTYRFADSYVGNNALLVDTNIPSATLTLTTPASLAALSLLTSAGHGPITNSVVVRYANGSAETNNVVVPDWFGSDAAVTANGRIDVGSLEFANVSSGNPNLYGVDVPLTVSGSPVASVELRNGSTSDGHTAVFAISGAAASGGEFSPLAVSGFNRDMVVEATAPQPLAGLNATTASMDAGVANTGFSYYERGYNTNAAPTNAITTGLPPAGSMLTNATSPDHRYALPASYGTNNAVLVDTDSSGTLQFATPATFSTLSFLTAAGNGAVTINYTVNHQDGSTENGSFISPDWFGNPNAALLPRGRVNVVTGSIDSVGSDNQRLYSVDVTLASTNSPITSIDLALSEGTGHAAVFAVSGALGNVAPLVAGQPVSVSVLEGGNAQFTATVSGTLPLTYTWQVETNGAFVDLQNGGVISDANTATLSLSGASFANSVRYRLAVTNATGSTFSLPATLSVLSDVPSILSSSDAVELVGGSSPDAEGVEHVIDGDTAKYLNFGADDVAAPFTGPVGFTVTPILGAEGSGTLVTALRVFVANDAPERDPASFTLEGSNSGTNFTQIATGSLALPDTRNASGQAIDPLAQAVQEVRFANSTPYKTYRVLFPTVKDSVAANSVQVAEVQLLGTASTQEPGITLTIAQNTNGTLTITSPEPGTLQSTTVFTATGTTWTDEGAIDGSVNVTATGSAKFYRVLVQQ